MTIYSTLDKYRAHLVIGILSVSSGHKAKKIISEAVKTLQAQQVGNETVQSLLDKVICQLAKIREFSTDQKKLAVIMSVIAIATEIKSKL